MVFFNYSTMQMAAKVVYYGPGLCGKTTNLQYIFGHTSVDSRGEMVSLETETDRTLFFDLLPIDVGSIAGFATRIQLYTVPGQVFYNTTRKLVLKGVDGVVFVADSQRPMLQANIDSFKNLEENLAEMGLSVDTLPLAIQYNKRDLADICTPDELNQAFNRGDWTWFEASAITGAGVFETLKGISKLTLMNLKKRLARTGPSTSRPSRSVPRPALTPAARPAPAATDAPTTAPRSNAGASAPPQPSGAPSEVAVAAPPTPPAVATAPPPQRATSGPPLPLRVGREPSAAHSQPATPSEPTASDDDAPRLAPKKTADPRSRGRVDVLAELEKIRRQTLRSASAPMVPAKAAKAVAASVAAGSNGQSEINREIQLTLRRPDFNRARRFLLTLQVEDSGNQIVDAIRDLQVDIGNLTEREMVMVRLSIALSAKE